MSAAATASNLLIERTDGAWMISLILETVLYGMGLLQAWLYFHWYPRDSWGIKATVIVLAIVETLQVVWYTQSLYIYLVVDFGHGDLTNRIHWSGSAQLAMIYTSAFIVQLYFAYCLYAINKKNAWITALIVVLALLQMGSGLAQDIVSGKKKFFNLLIKTKDIHELQAAATLVCDVTITTALVVTLGRKKSDNVQSNTLLQKLMVNAINRGTLTSICAILNFVLFLAIPNTLYYMYGLQLSSKLYMNSMLATLNSRQHLRRQTNGLPETGVPQTRLDFQQHRASSTPMHEISSLTATTSITSVPPHPAEIKDASKEGRSGMPVGSRSLLPAPVSTSHGQKQSFVDDMI